MASLPDIEKKYYHEFIEQSCSSAVGMADLRLPLFHSCSGEQFRRIIGSGQILTSMCAEFSEDLLYLFYGKPSYRLLDDDNTRDLGHFPSSFIVRCNHLGGVKRIFPFDSGAFFHNILSDVCGHFSTKPEAKVGIESYDLGSELDRLAKFINVFYGGDKAYFNVEPHLDRSSLKGMCFELSRLLDLAQSHAKHKWDGRATTAEVQIESPINLDGASIEAVIIPAQLISNDPDLQNFFYDQGIDVETYNAARTKPNSVTDLISKVAEDYLARKGLI